ncbi:hypothetical protein KIH74_10195 [Kineosporia sp. J2-2]|uniref:Uncharacterized protein n=1 Tax=Kineosporia corallincola TaxID=2835133 RepID=A0ABS5TDY8_9ACTN|nr:hypothetical protein [Kineosporia corallincola]MBT0769292.1 hypothetical protein [Kineosporia corallincola]
MTEVSGLPGLPGSDHPGTGPVVEPLLDGLLADIVTGSAEEALTVHRDHRRAWYGDLVGALRVPVPATEQVIYALHTSDAGLPVLLVASPSPDGDDMAMLENLRRARFQLLDNHRVELTGVELPFAGADAGPVAERARIMLDSLDFTVPAWFVVPGEPGWEPAFDVLAADGAESVALHLTGSPEVGAGSMRALIDRDLPYAVTAGVSGLVTDADGYGLLNVLCATRAALNGAEAPEMAAILAETDVEPLAAAVRRMSEADAATARAFLPSVVPPSIREIVTALEAEGLIEPDAA